MTKYIGAVPVPQAIMSREEFTATASQTTFATSGYQPGYIRVYLNGVLLASSEYTATNGSDVVLGTGATLNDVVVVHIFNPFEAAFFNSLSSDVAMNGYKFTAFTSTGIDDNATATAITIDGSQGVGIGSAPISGYDLTVANSTGSKLILSSSAGGTELYFDNSGANLQWVKSDRTAGDLRFGTANTERMRIDSSGKLGVGTSSISGDADRMHVDSAGTNTMLVEGAGTSQMFSYHDGLGVGWADGPGATYGNLIYFNTSANAMQFIVNGSERARIDSSGNVGIGTSSAVSILDVRASSPVVQVRTTNASGNATLRLDGLASNGADLAVVNLKAIPEGASPASSFVIETRNSGGTISEAARIDSSGVFMVGKTASGSSNIGFEAGGNGSCTMTRNSGQPLIINRTGTDGDLLLLRHADVTEGSITVSGTTVSYNGAHLSRWFQAPGVDYDNIEDRPEILRGSVLTNLDEMCDWEGEDNEQLNKMEVSSVKGDKHVAGVFQGWDDDDDTYLNDGYCAMTGDFVIRIAKGCTVARGDLLMSAGDGTACPQEGELADVVRSCTVAKVTSTTVSHTYDDGSYLVPCVLMAC